MNNHLHTDPLYSELSDVEVLRRVLMLRRPGRALSLLDGGLTSFLWADAPQLRSFSAIGRKKIRAAQSLVRRFAGSAIGSAPLARAPEPVVRFLFLAQSDPCREVRGALLLDGSGKGLGSYVLGRPGLRRPAAGERGVFQAAVSSGAKYLVLFHVRPGGAPEATGGEEAFAETLDAPARLLGVEIADRWAITGPTCWRSLGPGSIPSALLGDGIHFVGSRRVPLNEVRDALAVALYHGKWGRKIFLAAPEVPPAREMAATPESLRELARTAPDDVSHPGLSPRANQALAATLELTRRLGRIEVPERPVAGSAEWLARELAPELRQRTGEEVWIVALDEHHRTTERQLVEPATADELSRLVLKVALRREVFRLVLLHVRATGPVSPRDWAEKLAPGLPEALSSVGVRWGGVLALTADTCRFLPNPMSRRDLL